MTSAISVKPRGIRFAIMLACLPAVSLAEPHITGINVRDDDSSTGVEISADAPVTYVYYKLLSPPRGVIDIAGIPAAGSPSRTQPNTRLLSDITLERIEAQSLPITRVTLILNEDAGIEARTSSTDKGRILVTLSGSASAPPVSKVPETSTAATSLPVPGHTANDTTTHPLPAAQESAAGTLPENTVAADSADPLREHPVPSVSPAATTTPVNVPAVAVPVTLPVSPAPQAHAGDAKTVPSAHVGAGSPFTHTADGVVINGIQSAGSPRVFRLSGPNRLVIDIPGSHRSIGKKSYTFGRFGITDIRVGTYPDKVRFVFDAGSEPLPPYRVKAQPERITITFGTH